MTRENKKNNLTLKMIKFSLSEVTSATNDLEYLIRKSSNMK